MEQAYGMLPELNNVVEHQHSVALGIYFKGLMAVLLLLALYKRLHSCYCC